MPDQTTNVFVSYSHVDASLVAPVVKLLRANKSLVFQDIDSIQPGKKWRSEISKGLAESDMVVVFWCDHASRSDEVCKEWKAAIEQEKDLLPLLLDATPLPPELCDFQWIDFRAMVGANHASIVSPPRKLEDIKAAPKKRSSRRLSFVVGFGAGLTALIILFSLLPKSPPRPPVLSAPPPPSSSPGVFDKLLSGDILVWLVLLLAVMGFLFLAWWLLRWPWKLKGPPEIAPVPFPDTSQIAQKIEEEILRRTALKRDAGA
jgi:TIR domain